MAAIISFNPNRAFKDGAFQGGAKVSFFLTGTTTPVTVYTDEARTTAHPTPVVADANGTFPLIWGEDGVNLKAVVTASDDSAIDTYDPVILGNIATQTAAGIALAPITGNSGTDVQAGIAANTDRLEALDLDAVTTFGRSLIGDPDAATARTTLGLGVSPGGTAAQATTSGTEIDFTGIPAGVNEVIVNSVDVGHGGLNFGVQLGTSLEFVTSGYSGEFALLVDNAADVQTSNYGSSIVIGQADPVSGVLRLNRLAAGSNTWCFSHMVGSPVGNACVHGAGHIILSDELTRVRLTCLSPFSNGEASVTWR